MAALVSWLPLLLRRRRRDALLAVSSVWPTTPAKLLKSAVVVKDPLAEGGTTIQTSQIEAAFYFALPAGYFGGHLRTVPLSDSEAHRTLRLLPEDLDLLVRYNPDNPDQSIALPADNPEFPATIWPAV